jgi:uncharacterized protein
LPISAKRCGLTRKPAGAASQWKRRPSDEQREMASGFETDIESLRLILVSLRISGGAVNVRFNLNSDGQPHIVDHGVTEAEVEETLRRPMIQASGRNGSTILIGRTIAGRALKIIFAEARDGDGIFIITAYDLPAKQLRTLKRRLKRRRK